MQIFHLLVASLGSAMAVVVLVVVLIYYIYLDVKPELARDLAGLWLTSAALAVIGVGAWIAAWGWWRRPAKRYLFALINGLSLMLGLTALAAIFAP